MSKIAIIVILAISAVTIAVFTAMPELDHRVVALIRQQRIWDVLREFDSTLRLIRTYNSYVAVALVLVAVVALCLRGGPIPVWQQMSKRAALLVVAVFVLGPGLAVSAFLKNIWGRPRPNDIEEFGGNEAFTAWWDPSGSCVDDCSFPSNETAVAFALLAAAVIAPARWRWAAVLLAVGFGVIVALMRLAFARHYPTDVIFAGLVSGLTVWTLHGLLYRWDWARVLEVRVRRFIASASL